MENRKGKPAEGGGGGGNDGSGQDRRLSHGSSTSSEFSVLEGSGEGSREVSGNRGSSGGRGDSRLGRGGRRAGQLSYAAVARAPAPRPPDLSPTTSGQSPSGSQMKELKVPQLPQNPAPFSTSEARRVSLVVNHFLVHFKRSNSIRQYDIGIKSSCGKEVSRSDWTKVKDAYFKSTVVASDGKRILFSTTELPTGNFEVSLGSRSYVVAVKFVKNLQLDDMFNGAVPRDILHGLDMVVRCSSSSEKVICGQRFYEKDHCIDLKRGVVALEGLQHTLKVTEQGLIVCADYSAMPFHKTGPVLDYIKGALSIDYKRGFSAQNISTIEDALRGVTVTLTHRVTSKRFTVQRLTSSCASEITFQLDNTGEEEELVAYYRKKYGRELLFPGLPCVILKEGQQNYVPLELCEVVEGQIFKKKMQNITLTNFRNLVLKSPDSRRQKILDLVKGPGGPCRGEIANHFDLALDEEMTEVTGRVIAPPSLKVGDLTGQNCELEIIRDDCQWNLQKNKVLHPKQLAQWSILDFTCARSRRRQEHPVEIFMRYLVKKCKAMGIDIADKPFQKVESEMSTLSDPTKLHRELQKAAKSPTGAKLQLLLCLMTKQDDGYGTLKYICEAELGIMTQCCLVAKDGKNKDRYFSMVALKINAKIGGSNMELFGTLPRVADVPFMFIGADVNHPPLNDLKSHSIAAVAGSLNCPGSSRYASRMRLQPPGCEVIPDVGEMCRELVQVYEQTNGVKPDKILYFRDGVSDGEFNKVLEEVSDIHAVLNSNTYKPNVTAIVVRKRHSTRLFPKGGDRNVLPGTVVDRKVVDNRAVDFFLCSHNGILGTSKPIHYYNLMDRNNFDPEELQQLVHNLCFISARCTQPVAMVTPVCYAHLAAYRGRLYYNEGAFRDEGSLRLHEDIQNQMFFV